LLSTVLVLWTIAEMTRASALALRSTTATQQHYSDCC
jgi:hypothetical protein